MSFGFGMGLPPAASAAGGPSLNLQFAGNSVLDSRITFTRASTGTYFNSAGVLTSAAINEPRFDYNPTTLAPLGLLIEEQRTNLVLNSATLITQSVTVTGVAHTLSFYGTGTVVISGTGTGTLVGSGAFPTRSTLTFTPTVGVVILTVTGTVTQAQLEAGAFATSYIPTTTAAATRAADDASITTLTPWVNATEGTLYSESLLTRQNATSGTNVFYIYSTSSSVIKLYYRGAGTTGATVVDATVTQADLTPTGALTANTVAKLSLAYKANDFASSGNGGTVVTDASGTVPTGLSQVLLGSPSAYLNGYIRTITYYPRRLSNAELQSITA